MRPSRYLFALGAIFIVLLAILIFGGSGSLHQKFSPKLGLDLAGGSELTLKAQTPDGKNPSSDSLEQARQIIENRVNGLGIAEAQVVTEGGNSIVVSAPGNSGDTLRQVGVPAQLRFRKVLNTMPDSPDGSTVTPSGSASPKPTGTATPSPAPTTPSPAPTTSAPAAAATGSP